VVSLAVSLAGQRQDYYSIAAWPAFALLISRAAEAPRTPAGRRAVAAALLGLIGLGALGLAGYALTGSQPGLGGRTTAPFGERNSISGAIAGMGERDWRDLRPLLLPATAALGGSGAAALAALRRAGGRTTWWIPVAAGAVGMQLSAMAGLQLFAPYFSLKELATALVQHARPAAVVVYDGPSHRASSLAFYADVALHWLERPETEFAVRARGQGVERFMTEEDLVRRWRSREETWLVVEERRRTFWRERLGGSVDAPVARSGTRVLVTNRPVVGGRGPAARVGFPYRSRLRSKSKLIALPD
jgi:hypothetical protein